LPRADISGNKDSNIKIVYLGNLIRTKGFFDLLHAVPKVLQENKSVLFRFAGAWRNDTDYFEADEYIEKHGLSNNVQFMGSVTGEKKYSLLNESNIFIFPTYYKYEGHPWVIVEALSAGLPIITTNHACIPESIRDGVNGFIVPDKDPESIAMCLIELIDNEALRLRMSAASLDIYKRRYTANHFIDGIKNCLLIVTG
jgi:glycosyltransferase involved in cell wall biosynthesis